MTRRLDRILIWLIVGMLFAVLVACGTGSEQVVETEQPEDIEPAETEQPATDPPTETEPPPTEQPTETLDPFVIALLSATPEPTPTVHLMPTLAQPLPLEGPGPYNLGVITVTLVDADRADRTLETEIWYPAIMPAGSDQTYVRDAVPDVVSGPFPLILYSHYLGANRRTDGELAKHLASHGFVVASGDHLCDREVTCLIDRPLDLLLILDELIGANQSLLNGVIDADQVGVMGNSSGAYTSLGVSGARIDPDYFLDWQANRDTSVADSMTLEDQTVPGVYLADSWDEITAYRAQFDDLEAGEPWPSLTDERIRASFLLVPPLGMLYGERGLETVSIPTMIMATTSDEFIPYDPEMRNLWTYLGAEERYLLTLLGHSHQIMHESPTGASYVWHFTTAFMGYYLQGQEDYAEYLTADYVEQFADIVWGLYEGDE